MAGLTEVVKSDNDKKDYCHLVLGNGLQVLLIHDPDIAAALEHQQEQEQGQGPAAHKVGADGQAPQV
jgi:hypothetical protein